MSGVVLRCPNCGTTRAATGECEACHEAQVRYYCTNHSPGRWLDGAACAQCGATFGAATRPPTRGPAPPAVAPPSPTRGPAGERPRGPGPTAPRAPPAAYPPPTAPPRTAPPPTARADRTGASRGGRARPPPEPDFRSGPPDGPADWFAAWQQRMRDAARAGARRPGPMAPIDPGAVPGRSGLGGCLLRFVLLMVFVVVGLLGTLFVFGASVLRIFLPY